MSAVRSPLFWQVRDMGAYLVEARFGSGTVRVRHLIEFLSDNVPQHTRTTSATRTSTRPIEFPSDNGPQYTARATQQFLHEPGFVVCNTPADSPESNGLSEAFVKTFKRDHGHANDVSNARRACRIAGMVCRLQLPAPAQALGMRSPSEFRRSLQLKLAA